MVTSVSSENALKDQMLIRGFAVMRDFLSPDLLKVVIDKYTAKEKEFSHQRVIPLGDRFIKEHLGVVIDTTLQDVKSEIFHPEMYDMGVFFATGDTFDLTLDNRLFLIDYPCFS